ncbi:MAG TPA: type II secretion system F family protein, partial [Dermatophilaceae bacterium]|nr:type II secretion system F family protein [Dermatophilaceae bacterium]
MVARTFTYEAIDGTGTLVKGTVEAESSRAASSNLNDQKLIPLAIAAEGSGLHKELKIPGLGRGTTLKDLAIFTRQFASMTTSGLTLIRALGILEDQTHKPQLKAAVSKVKTDVEGGMTLSAAMGEHPEQFPLMAVNMIKAGETGGFLDGALERIATMYEADANLRAKIKSAMMYPIMVLLFSVLMGTGVIVFIVPIFEKMFADLGGALPLPTQVMVNLSHNMWWAAPLILITAVVCRHFFRRAVRTNDSFRLKVDRVKLRMPVFGPLATKLAISRWARNLGSLLGVGVPIIQALDVVGDTSGNAVVTEAMHDVRSAVRVGLQMSGPLSRNPLFPPMVVQMLEVGEETGQITEMLDKVADFYDHEVQTATDSLTSTMEPLLVVLLGSVIGT